MVSSLRWHERSMINRLSRVFDDVYPIKKAKELGFRCNVNCTIFDNVNEDGLKNFLNYVTDKLKVDGITISPGFAYERPQIRNIYQRSNTNFFGMFLNQKTSKNGTSVILVFILIF